MNQAECKVRDDWPNRTALRIYWNQSHVHVVPPSESYCPGHALRTPVVGDDKIPVDAGDAR